MNLQKISAVEAQELIVKEQAIIIDVREPAEFKTQHITGAILLPGGQIDVDSLPTTNKKIIIYCQKGSRGTNACKKLNKESDSLNIYNLEGGIESWVQEGFAINSGHSKVLPIDRQVQLTIGVLLLLSSILGLSISNIFMIIPIFLGAGLTFAGLSGSCGLAVLIAKMPWNQKQ